MQRVRVVEGEAMLIGTRCGACGHTTFPQRARCPACGSSEVAEALLGPDGVVQSAAELHVSTEECDAPYTLGLVRLDDGVTLLARVTGTDGAGARVYLAADEESGEFWFEASAHARMIQALSDDETRDGGDPR